MQNLLARGRNEVFSNNCVDVFPEAAISTNLLINAQLSVGTCQKTSLPLLHYDDDGGSKDIVSMEAYDELVMVLVKLMVMMLFVSTGSTPVVVTVSGVSPITYPL